MWPRHVTRVEWTVTLLDPFSPQVAHVRTRRMLCRLRARRSQTCRVLYASGKRTGGSSGWNLLPEAEQTGRFRPLRGGRLSRRMGIEGRSKIGNRLRLRHDFRFGRINGLYLAEPGPGEVRVAVRHQRASCVCVEPHYQQVLQILRKWWMTHLTLKRSKGSDLMTANRKVCVQTDRKSNL